MLTDLQRQYEARGATLVYGHGDPIEILSRFVDRGWDIVATADPASRYGHDRDNTAAQQCDVTFIDGDGLVRNADDPREGWSDHVETWLTDDLLTWSPAAVDLPTVSMSITPDRVSAAYDVTPAKTTAPTGGREPALSRLEQFTATISTYLGRISAPSDAATGTSRLSPYLRFGCVSVREVYQYVTEHATDASAVALFVSRLFWNRHYNQKLVDWPGWTKRAVNPVLEGFHADTYDPELVAAWKHGKTGYPMVDASMRCLEQTGWLNFRMRAMRAPVFCDLMQQPWRIGADWFYSHLIDADPAINYTQFQTQAGVVGVNMERVYNPRKLVRDTDPDGKFITKWVPELESLPIEFLDQPEKTPLAIQAECEISIGDDYPYPVIEYEAARERIYKKIDRVRDRAKRALRDPVIARRASLSRRGGTGGSDTDTDTEAGSDRAEDPADTVTSQASLDDFN